MEYGKSSKKMPMETAADLARLAQATAEHIRAAIMPLEISGDLESHLSDLELLLAQIASELEPDRTASRPSFLRLGGQLTRIEQDPELRRFIDARLGIMTQLDIVAACRDIFGAARAPSQSGLSRYTSILRERVEVTDK